MFEYRMIDVHLEHVSEVLLVKKVMSKDKTFAQTLRLSTLPETLNLKIFNFSIRFIDPVFVSLTVLSMG